jgi:imidazolonepropionase-like amidohydrolase
MHPILYRNSEPSSGFVQRMRESGAYQVSTLSILDAPLGKFQAERLDDPLLGIVVPPPELAAARGPDGGWAENHATIANVVPWLPSLMQGIVAGWMFRESAQRAALETSERSLRRLHAAGVPIVLGSDTPYQSWAVYAFHGPTTLREVELLAEAGLSPMEALQASTRVPAEMIGLADEIGTLEVGKRADLVVVRGDPLTDLRALRAVLWTVRDGVAGTPREWMSR